MGRYRKRPRRSNVMVVPSPWRGLGQAFPNVYMCQMPHKSTLIKTTDSTGYDPLGWNMNDLTDPSGIQGATDVKYHTLLNNVYRGWVVLACRWKVTFFNMEASSPMAVMALPRENDDVPGNEGDFYLARGSVNKMASPFGMSGHKQILSGYMNFRKFLGVDVAKEADYWGTQVTSPATTIWFNTGVAFLLAGTFTYHMRLERTFYVKFFDPKQLDDSI